MYEIKIEIVLDRVASEFDDPEEQRYIDKWLHLRPYFPSMVEWLNSMIKTIQGTSRTSVTFGFSTVSELLSRFGSTNLFFKKWFPVDAGRCCAEFLFRFAHDNIRRSVLRCARELGY